MEVQPQPAEAAKVAASLRQSSLSSYFPAKRGGPGAANPPCKRSKPLPPTPVTSPMHGLATAAVHSKRLICFSPEGCGGGRATASRAELAATPRQGGSTLTTDTAAAGAAAAATPAESAASGSPRYRTSFDVEADLASQSAGGAAATPTRARRSLCSDFLSVAASPPPLPHFGTPQSRLAASAPGLPRSREDDFMRPPLRQGARLPPLALPLLRSEPTVEAQRREEAAAAVAVQVAALVGLHAGGLRSNGGRPSSQTEPDARLHAGLKQERLRILKSIGNIVHTLHKDATLQLPGLTTAAPVEHASAAAEEANVAGKKSLSGNLDLVKMPSCFGQSRSPERHGAPNNLHIHLRAALRTFVEGVVAKLVEERHANGKRGTQSGVAVTRQDVLKTKLIAQMLSTKSHLGD
eukprot:SM000063S20043  [mRNA]  locus=s63:502545:504350:+ [translate_table: standard]